MKGLWCHVVTGSDEQIIGWFHSLRLVLLSMSHIHCSHTHHFSQVHKGTLHSITVFLSGFLIIKNSSFVDQTPKFQGYKQIKTGKTVNLVLVFSERKRQSTTNNRVSMPSGGTVRNSVPSSPMPSSGTNVLSH